MKNDEAQPSPEAAREEFFRGVEPEAAQNSLADREAKVERLARVARRRATDRSRD
jgi:hypothetical protein